MRMRRGRSQSGTRGYPGHWKTRVVMLLDRTEPANTTSRRWRLTAPMLWRRSTVRWPVAIHTQRSMNHAESEESHQSCDPIGSGGADLVGRDVTRRGCVVRCECLVQL